jgi:hypothetical protein
VLKSGGMLLTQEEVEANNPQGRSLSGSSR